MRLWGGGGRGHNIRPTWPLNTSPWEGDVPAAPLWPPKGWAGWGLWSEDVMYVVEAGEGALGGQEPTELWEQVFGSCQPGTPGPGLPPCKSQTWGPEMGLPQAALLLLWPLRALRAEGPRGAPRVGPPCSLGSS